MDVEQLRQLRRAVPWKPYVLIMVDGRRFIIDQPPYMGVSPNGRLVLVVTEGSHVERLRPENIRDAVFLDEMYRPTASAPPQARGPA
jgi:hypothetical protein